MKEDAQRDCLYAEALDSIEKFTFDDRVAAVFPDMIRRSVPGYATLIGLLGVLAERVVMPHSNVYDLGCSLGAVTASMRARVEHANCRFIAVDKAKAMVDRARETLEEMPGPPVEVHCADIRNFEIAQASLVVLNFTLQFVLPGERVALLRRIQAGMNPGGVLVLSEKINAGGSLDQDELTDLHLRFKRAQGYSQLEISQKRAALEEVLIPETLATHRRRLLEVGFARVLIWYQALNFVSLIAHR